MAARSQNCGTGKRHRQLVAAQAQLPVFATRLLLFRGRATARNGLLIVKASGFMPASTLDQVTGAAIGNLSRARGE